MVKRKEFVDQIPATKSKEGKSAKEVIQMPVSPNEKIGNPSQQVFSEPPQPVGDKIELLDKTDLTVEIRNLKFSYLGSGKADYLLKDVNMTLPKSAIYGLLGPSGCGKTTLIKLILGRLNPSSGTVKVNGRPTGDPLNNIPGIGIGFMPQDIALYGEFSIKETLQYFARIYGLESEHKKNRIQFLITFLDLPDPDRKVGVLSGGQKRRVSLAVAIVHNPPFLILDEPTVGVDPLLRERIWEHLVTISSNEKTSILVTTHYIEEARRAHIVAMARGGTFLVEHSPHFLLRHFQVDNLEDVFLKVCLFEAKESNYKMPKNFFEGLPPTEPKTDFKDKGVVNIEQFVNSSNWNKFVALLHKNFVRLFRNLLMLGVQIVLPTITIALFCLCIGKLPHELDVAVYNEEANNSSAPKAQLLSTEYLKLLSNSTIIDKDYDSNKSAYDSVEKGSTYGALMFRSGFSSALSRRAMAPGFSATDEDIFMSTIQYYGDFSDLIITQTLVKTFYETALKFAGSLISKMSSAHNNPNNSFGLNPNAIKPMVELHAVYGSLDPNFRDFATPGIMICVTYLLAVTLTALSMVGERKEGLLERTMVAGVRIYEILFAQIFVQLVVLFAQTILLMIVIFPVFQIANKGRYVYIVLLVIMQGVCGMTFGLMISSISRDEQSALMLSMGSFIPYLVMSGIMWPLEGMDKILRSISLALPQTLPVIALRNIMLKGFEMTKTFVYLGYVATIGLDSCVSHGHYYYKFIQTRLVNSFLFYD